MASKAPSKKKKKRSTKAADAGGKRLVIVESPAKAKTINKYLGSDYVVKASVGHVRDLPSRNPKGVKQPVPGVDLDNDFAPTYEILSGKNKTITELKRLARSASEVWFATDLDREGEAIAWHLAEVLGIPPAEARRVVFNAITREEITRAFGHPRTLDLARVDAQQARRILDRIVGYCVSPLLWKKVARGLSAGRVQSVAVRLVVEREREIRSFIPDEQWRITGRFALDPDDASSLAPAWRAFLATPDAKGNPPTVKAQNAWLASNRALRGELISVGGDDPALAQEGSDGAEPADLTQRVEEVARLAGLVNITTKTDEDPDGKGPARFRRSVQGDADPGARYRVHSIETKRTRSRPGAPFITSTLQQGASTRLGFGAQRTMRVAQRLYEGIEIKGEGNVGLITYMRTDSTHLSREAVDRARQWIGEHCGSEYLPEKPAFFSSSNKDAQEAHEAIRPASLNYPPDEIRAALTDEQYKLYKLIWSRFLACQMVPAEWDSTSVILEGGSDPDRPCRFRASGRVLVFDGFYRVMGVPTASDEQTLPQLDEGQDVAPFSIEPEQRFTSPPARYTEASLIKMLESEGIGRPSTYASIIGVIQDRKYVELVDRRFYATDLGEVVTDKLIEAFPDIMEVGYTRDMEAELDKIEDEHLNWTQVLHHFYDPFKEKLEKAEAELKHAKAETTPAPEEYTCEDCGAPTVYRFGKSGRFLSCSRYPDCNYASPVDRDGKPRPIETTNVACHLCGSAMISRSGRFGPFLGCSAYPECQGILKLDKKTGRPLAPTPPPLQTDLPCPKCDAPLNLRSGARGPWLSCSTFPKCRGRGKWTELTDEVRAKWTAALEAHEKQHPIPIIHDLDGNPLTDAKGKPLPEPDPEPEGLSEEEPRSMEAVA